MTPKLLRRGAGDATLWLDDEAAFGVSKVDDDDAWGYS